ncbi:ABC transporter permease [Enterococcus sp. 669A]|uniref:ABC transporter permease n=1 Tax=Candidatus Enterococcus moelleringii TaxID=2815325 RepID=A0ABS3LE96_9ENTE|nr:ABC transporter permease [Enterococcus sp. 669A]MBO1307945.1 ABC transporter permease [Enterococcus sp. 669A]
MNTFAQANAKLRRKDYKNALLLFGCILFATALISAFSIIMQSDTVQTTLPKGGDSRKQMMMILAMAIVGCSIFTVYASSLFFRSKSKQIGVFKVLGAGKKQLRNSLLTEVSLLAATGSGLGFLLGTPLAAGIWQFFRLLVDSPEMKFSLNLSGYVWGLGFALFVVTILLISALLFLRRQNIMDILYQQRKSETVSGVKSWYGWGGILMMASGTFLGLYGLPTFFREVLHRQPPIWLNLIYLIPLAGLYLFLVYVVVRDKNGKNKYKNIVSHSMMKFQGRSTVRNMCVIAILIAGAYFAIFYIPSMMTRNSLEVKNRPVDFVYYHRLDQAVPDEAAVRKMAAEEKVEITQWNEMLLTTLAADSTQEYDNGDGTFRKEYIPFSHEQHCISASEFSRLSGKPVDVSAGSVKPVRGYGQDSSSADDVTLLTNPDTQTTLSISIDRHLTYAPFTGYLVMNDDDFATITQGLTDEWREKMILFNVADVEASYNFAKRLRNEIIDQSAEEPVMDLWYDRVGKLREGDDYWADALPVLDNQQRDSSHFITRWKYLPSFRILDQVDFVNNMAVFLMLFVFIAIICFTAVLVIAYTRCTTIALTNRQIYEDLSRLGANRAYLIATVTKQVRKIIAIPIAVGTVLMFLFYAMILYFNSTSLDATEWATLGVDLIVVLVISGLMWLFYRLTLRKTCRLLNLIE